jgi:hypothetical protein
MISALKVPGVVCDGFIPKALRYVVAFGTDIYISLLGARVRGRPPGGEAN